MSGVKDKSKITSKPPRRAKKIDAGFVIFVAVAISVLLLIIAFILYRRRRNLSTTSTGTSSPETSEPPANRPSLEEKPIPWMTLTAPPSEPQNETPPETTKTPPPVENPNVEPVIETSPIIVISPAPDRNPVTPVSDDTAWITFDGTLDLNNPYGMYSFYGYKQTVERPNASLGVLVSNFGYSLQWANDSKMSTVKMTIRISQTLIFSITAANFAIKRFPIFNVDEKVVKLLKRSRIISSMFETETEKYDNTNPRIVYDENTKELNKSLPQPRSGTHYFDTPIYLELSTENVFKNQPGYSLNKIPVGTFTFILSVEQ